VRLYRIRCMHPSISMVLESPAPGFLVALALPAMAYFFFVFYGGQTILSSAGTQIVCWTRTATGVGY
jgi:hypothetical protein